MEKFKQFLEDVNNSKYYCFGSYWDEHDDYDIEFVKKSEYCDEHRWYTIGRWIYKIKIDSVDYYFAVYEVDIIKTEMMGYEDCGYTIECVPVKEVTVVDYVDVED